jgi:hypothetical protein
VFPKWYKWLRQLNAGNTKTVGMMMTKNFINMLACPLTRTLARERIKERRDRV